MAGAAKAAGDSNDLDSLFPAWDGLVPAIEPELAAVFREAAKRAGAGLDASDSVEMSVVNQDALVYSRARSAELVGRRWVNGRLVDNPDAKWAITDTTRRKLRSILDDAYDHGWTPNELGTEVNISGVFGEYRASMIARTEMATAQVQGAISAAKQVGIVGKESQLSGDHTGDDECDDAANQGVIGIDDDFDPGSDPPYHPNCNCAVIFYTAEDPEAAHLVDSE